MRKYLSKQMDVQASPGAPAGVSRQQLYMILREERAVTAEMAMRLGKYCGNGAEVWLNMQSAHDLWKARHALADEVAEIPTRAAS